jgi:hypothetical protein
LDLELDYSFVEDKNKRNKSRQQKLLDRNKYNRAGDNKNVVKSKSRVIRPHEEYTEQQLKHITCLNDIELE